ncbi:MAG: hypothetical protein K2L07_13325, partial [Lachnospiraceae bacterium]|nr:hypothetical protein [Lachnospiraceae bacterium]
GLFVLQSSVSLFEKLHNAKQALGLTTKKRCGKNRIPYSVMISALFPRLLFLSEKALSFQQLYAYPIHPKVPLQFPGLFLVLLVCDLDYPPVKPNEAANGGAKRWSFLPLFPFFIAI